MSILVMKIQVQLLLYRNKYIYKGKDCQDWIATALYSEYLFLQFTAHCSNIKKEMGRVFLTNFLQFVMSLSLCKTLLWVQVSVSTQLQFLPH